MGGGAAAAHFAYIIHNTYHTYSRYPYYVCMYLLVVIGDDPAPCKRERAGFRGVLILIVSVYGVLIRR